MTQDVINEINEIKVSIGKIEERLKSIEMLQKNFITKWEFTPVKGIAYGIAVMILSAIISTLIKLVIMK